MIERTFDFIGFVFDFSRPFPWIWLAVIVFQITIIWGVATKKISDKAALYILGGLHSTWKRQDFKLSRREILLGLIFYVLLMLIPFVCWEGHQGGFRITGSKSDFLQDSMMRQKASECVPTPHVSCW